VEAIDTDVAAAILREVAAQVGELRYNLWIKDQTRLEVTDHEVVVGVPNLFVQEWLIANFLQPLRKAAEIATGRKLVVRLVVDGDMFRAQRAREQGSAPAPQAAAATPAAAPAPPRRQAKRGQTLDNFVVGASNRMAHAAALQVVQGAAAHFNPLVFYGAVGLGKTHLLRGIEHAVLQQHRHMKVLYIAAETFTNTFLEDMRTHRLAAFRQRLRGVDILLIDDAQFVAGKKATQAELLHTYEALDAEGKQFVLAVDRHPRQIEEFSNELSNRLLAGMACPLEPPDYDTRLAILDRKSQSLGLALPRDVLEFVATHFRSNVRELEGALNSLKAQVDFSHARLDVAAARQALGELMRQATRTVGLKDVDQAVCQTFDLSPVRLCSADRSHAVSQPRMLAMYLARKYTDASYDAIGKHFGGRNHSTVMSAERKVQSWLDQSSVVLFNGRPWPVVEAIRAIEQRLK
jgi:chromosomal replication initiator protein